MLFISESQAFNYTDMFRTLYNMSVCIPDNNHTTAYHHHNMGRVRIVPHSHNYYNPMYCLVVHIYNYHMLLTYLSPCVFGAAIGTRTHKQCNIESRILSHRPLSPIPQLDLDSCWLLAGGYYCITGAGNRAVIFT